MEKLEIHKEDRGNSIIYTHDKARDLYLVMQEKKRLKNKKTGF